MTTSGTLVILFCLATAVAIVVRRLRVPYTVALVVAGLALGSFKVIDPPHLTKELLFTFFLPGLLFEAAFHLDLSVVRTVWRSVVALAVPGVLVATGIAAGIIVLVGGALGMGDVLDWKLAITFAAIVAATDPVAVTAIFRDLDAPPQLATLVEGESLLNDGTAVVLFSLVVAYVVGSDSGPVAMSAEFLLVAGGGLAVGLFVGWGTGIVIQQLDEAMIEIALTMIAAYGSFVLAEAVGASGVLATVAAGVMCGRHGRDQGMSAASRAAAESFWLYVAFALNSIVFLLIGFEFDGRRFLSLWPEALVAFTAMLIARAVIVGAVVLIQRRTRKAMPPSWGLIAVWGGLRGALSMVLALALPTDFPQRDLIISLTTGVVVASVVVQGTSMPLLLRRVGLKQ